MIVECPKCHAEDKDDSKHCGDCAAPPGPGAASLIDEAGVDSDFPRRQIRHSMCTPDVSPVAG